MRWRRVAVRGPSMSPALRDGDVVLARFGAPVRTGDVVLVRWSARPAQLSVKRADRPVGDGLVGAAATTPSAPPTRARWAPPTLWRSSQPGCGPGRAGPARAGRDGSGSRAAVVADRVTGVPDSRTPGSTHRAILRCPSGEAVRHRDRADTRDLPVHGERAPRWNRPAGAPSRTARGSGPP